MVTGDSVNCTKDVFLEARALLAVGMDGSVVILQVNAENQYLVRDACVRNVSSDVLIFSPEAEPQGPGLYEFKGYSSIESAGSADARVIHRGICAKVAC